MDWIWRTRKVSMVNSVLMISLEWREKKVFLCNSAPLSSYKPPTDWRTSISRALSALLAIRLIALWQELEQSRQMFWMKEIKVKKTKTLNPVRETLISTWELSPAQQSGRVDTARWDLSVSPVSGAGTAPAPPPSPPWSPSRAAWARAPGAGSPTAAPGAATSPVTGGWPRPPAPTTWGWVDRRFTGEIYEQAYLWGGHHTSHTRPWRSAQSKVRQWDIITVITSSSCPQTQLVWWLSCRDMLSTTSSSWWTPGSSSTSKSEYQAGRTFIVWVILSCYLFREKGQHFKIGQYKMSGWESLSW